MSETYSAWAGLSCRQGLFQTREEITRNHGGLFISDEVQTAWADRDKWFGTKIRRRAGHYHIGQGNGQRCAARLDDSTPEVADAFPGLTFSTFGATRSRWPWASP